MSARDLAAVTVIAGAGVLTALMFLGAPAWSATLTLAGETAVLYAIIWRGKPGRRSR